MKRIQLAAILGLSLSASRGFGSESVLIHPFQNDSVLHGSEGDDGDSFDQGLGLMRLPKLDFRDRILDIAKKWELNPRIQAVETGFKGFSLYQDSKFQTLNYKFDVDGVPLCEFQVKFIESLKGRLAAFGKIPRVDSVGSFVDSDWVAMSDYGPMISQTLAFKGLDPEFTVDHAAKCLLEKDGELRPVWEVDVVSAGLLYHFTVDGQDVYRYEPKHFHATGTANIYANNSLDSKVEPFTLRDMKETGYLENPYFITCVPSGKGSSICPPSSDTSLPYPMVKEPSLNFNYDPVNEPSLFVQTSVFTNVNRTLEWLQERGYTNFGNVPVRLAVHAAFQGDSNNALYEPRSAYSVIYVGDGDGNVLKNLGTDSDVVSHELGHHVIYNSVKKIEGESLVIHEGLADFFTFARTGNACLGESICTDTNVGTRICTKPRQCLRSGENDFALNSKNLPSEPHQKSQFISAMLWDLFVKDGIAINDLTRLILKTIDLLVTDSGYQHLVVGLLLADDALYQGTHCQTIIDRAVARGLGLAVEGVSCTVVQDDARPRSSVKAFLDGKEPTPTQSSSSKKTDKKTCGTVGSPMAGGQDMSVLLLWCLPLIVGLIRRLRG